MIKAKVLASLLGTASIVVGSSFVSDAAQAVTLQTGDFFRMAVSFQNDPITPNGLGGIISIEERSAVTGLGTGNFVMPVQGMRETGNFLLTNARVNGQALNITDPQLGDISSLAFNDNQSFRLTDGFMGDDFPDGTLPNATFPDAVNSFRVLEDDEFNPGDVSGARPFWNITLPENPAQPGTSGEVRFELDFFTATQNTPLTEDALTAIEFNGKGTFFADNIEAGEAEFSAALVFNPDLNGGLGAWEADGGATFIVVDDVSVPEPGTIVGLLALSGLALGRKLKKQS